MRYREFGATGLTVEVFHRDQLEQMGCGGILGVNQGSVEPPRVVRLRDTRQDAGTSFIVMELGQGATLYKVLSDGKVFTPVRK